MVEYVKTESSRGICFGSESLGVGSLDRPVTGHHGLQRDYDHDLAGGGVRLLQHRDEAILITLGYPVLGRWPSGRSSCAPAHRRLRSAIARALTALRMPRCRVSAQRLTDACTAICNLLIVQRRRLPHGNHA
jgi:hypothetical protein